MQLEGHAVIHPSCNTLKNICACSKMFASEYLLSFSWCPYIGFPSWTSTWEQTCKPCDLQQLTWSCFCVICKFGHDLCAGILGSNDCFRQFIESFFCCWRLPIFLQIKLQLNSSVVDEDVAYHNWLLISSHLIRQHPRVGQITSKSTKRTAVIWVAFCWNKTNCPPIISRWCRPSSLSQTIVVWACCFLIEYKHLKDLNWRV